jgi:hypothetical protein
LKDRELVLCATSIRRRPEFSAHQGAIPQIPTLILRANASPNGLQVELCASTTSREGW